MRTTLEDYQKMIAALSRVLKERTEEGRSLAEALRLLLLSLDEANVIGGTAREALAAYDARTVEKPHE